MKALLSAVLFLISWPALAADLTFSVHRGGCGAPPDDWTGFGEVRHEWVSPSTLRVVTWVAESASEQVIDGSGLMHSIQGGEVHLSYAEKFTPIAPGTPIAACLDFVCLQFEIAGIQKRDYALTIEKRSSIATATLIAD